MSQMSGGVSYLTDDVKRAINGATMLRLRCSPRGHIQLADEAREE